MDVFNNLNMNNVFGDGTHATSNAIDFSVNQAQKKANRFRNKFG